MGLGIVCDEPVNQTQTDITGALKKVYDFRQIVVSAIKTLETGDDKFLLTMDFPLSCLEVRRHGGRLLHSLSILIPEFLGLPY